MYAKNIIRKTKSYKLEVYYALLSAFFVNKLNISGKMVYALFFQLSEISFACSIEPAKTFISKIVLFSSIILHFTV